MPSVADLRRRIANVRDVRQLTRAMKAVAAARLSRARAAAEAARPYAGAVAALLARLAAAEGAAHPLLRKPGEGAPAGRRCLLVIAGDRGLAGGFHAAVVRAALEAARQAGPDPAFIAVGRKAAGALRFHGADLPAAFTGLDDPVPPDLGRAVAARLLDGLAAGEFAAVDLVYNRFVSVLVQRPTVEPLLPVVPPAPEDDERRAGPRPLYIIEPSPRAVLDALLPAYVAARVHRALLESRAGEHAARMAAMDAATRNAGEVIDRLTRELSRQRQQAITKEILDIVGGAAALENR